MDGVKKESLGRYVIEAIAKAKTDLKNNHLRPYRGLEIIDPEIGKRGARMFKADVGEGRPNDPLGTRGSKRLVLLQQSGRVSKLFYTDNHFRPGSWKRIVDL
jgi:hypothetical protein